MIVKCEWCGETYDFGMVGSQIIGSGHTCQVRRECETEGCGRCGNVRVAEGTDGSDGLAFSCVDHIAGRVIVGAQFGASDD